MNNLQLRMHAMMERERLLQALTSATWKMIHLMEEKGLTFDDVMVECPSPEGVSEPRWRAMLRTFYNRNGEL